MNSREAARSYGWTCQQISAFVLATGDSSVSYGNEAYGMGLYPSSGATWSPGYDVKEDD